MVNTNKLLYILPDLAYIAELLPTKKEHDFSINSFRQINGEFITEDGFIAENINKLFSKIEPEEYHLILPDFLFTNTIVNAEGSSETTIIDHIKKVLLPNLGLDTETHVFDATILTSFKGKSKVQISALEKELMIPIQMASQINKVAIKAVSPLSWTIKSSVSLEPSISVIQLGSNLYSCLHYIGIDQANNFSITESEAIIETIKTLKGSEPSIQTIYLISNALTEETLKDQLSNTLPLQQLAVFKEEDSKMPSYVKYCIEKAARTLSITDYPVPNFKLDKLDQKQLESLSNTQASETSIEDNSEENMTKTAQVDIKEDKIEEKVELKKIDINADLENSDEIDSETEVKTQTSNDLPKPNVKVINAEDIDVPIITPVKEEKIDLTQFAGVDKDVVKDVNKDENIKTDDIEITQPEKKAVEEDVKTQDEIIEIDMDNLDVVDENKETEENVVSEEPTIIKNQNKGVKNMLKMVLISLSVFVATIAIGIGVGYGFMKYSESSNTQVAVATPTPAPTATPAPTPTPTPEPEVKLEELSILIVNATTKAGYAGKTKTALTEAGVKVVDAKNAKGKYEAGLYMLAKEENPSLLKALTEATELELTFAEGYEVEDTAGKYDAVIVLGE